jgi:copper(I)-binding protein
MAEWLRRGLQILARRFDSGSGLQLSRQVMKAFPIFASLLVAACSAEPAPMITVSDATVSAISSNAAAYFTLTNSGGADRLLSVAAPDVGEAAMHDTIMTGDVMRMEPIKAGVAVPANGRVRFSAMGKHVMIKIQKPVSSPSVTLVLRFERQGEVKVSAAVSGPRG